MTKPNDKRPGSRHGKIADGKRRASYIENVETFEVLEKAAKRMRVTTSTIIREATLRFIEDIQANGGVITFSTEAEDEVSSYAPPKPVKKHRR